MKRQAAAKPVMEANSIAWEAVRSTRRMLLDAAASATAGTSVTDNAVNSAVGKKIKGIAIPVIRPNSLTASAALNPYAWSLEGISTFSQADSADPVTRLAVSGNAMTAIMAKLCLAESEGRLRRRFLALDHL
jgi:hypothetical protein